MTNKGAAVLQAALEELRQRRAEIQALRAERNERIAVIGMACRFPGSSDTPQSFWELLNESRSAVTEIPRARWDIERYYDPDPGKPGKMATRFGAFLNDVDLFDASFFNISPREAMFLDPQQRILLEVAWEAIENANLAPDQLRQSPTGVYVGITCFDHAVRIAGSAERSSSYTGTGSALNMAAGRLSFFLGLNGPSMAIDTACSSSLVCLHLACESLRSRESRMALACGINLMLSPDVMVSFSQARMLAPDGRCKTFDAAADGYVRGEGCGMVLLKRLPDALSDGNRILGVIRGTAVDHGGASGGLTVPSRASEERVMRRALEQAGVSSREVDYVEAHGTGTSLGDPIEIEALAEVYGAARQADRPLIVGSVKTNIGHLESAAGIAGLIKILLSFEHDKIPAHLHFVRPNPHTAWDGIPVRVAAKAIAWPREPKKRIAGLSAFGFSGTNAHAVIEEPPRPPAPKARRELLTISAKSEAALHALAERYEELLASTPREEWPAICCAAATGRNHFPFRMARVLSSGGTYRGRAQAGHGLRVALALTGDGTRFARELYDSEAVFREAFDRCGTSLADGDSDVSRFASDYAWAELWKAWGVFPYVFLGAGVGELAAACQAGVMSLQDALKLVAATRNAADFARVLGEVRLSSPTTRLASKEVTHPDYWIRQRTSPVNCAEAMRSFSDCALLPSPRAGEALERSVAWLYVKGLDLDWAAFFASRRQPRATLPNYPFERQRFWLEIEEPKHVKPDCEKRYYEVRWEEQPVGPSGTARNAAESTWLILADDRGTGAQLATVLRTRGARHVRAEQETADPEQLRRVLAETNERGRRIVFLWGLSENGVSSRSCVALLHLVQELHGSTSRIWVVTRSAVEAGGCVDVSGSAQAVLLGFAKGAALEHPELFGGIVDLDRTPTKYDADLLLNEILSESADDQVAFREGVRYVPRLTKFVGETAPLKVSSSGAYLITGGYGFLGLKIARWLTDRGAHSIILAGRSGASSADAKTAIEELRRKGADVRCEQLDIADPVAVESFFEAIQHRRTSLRGIIHAAGVAGYKPLLQIDRAELESVLRPKVNGAWLLHEHSQDLSLDFFILYSSIASAWGSRDQAHYSAANRYLDALAHHRRQLGLPAQSINWGPWAQGGMTSSEAEGLLRRMGINTLDPEAALETLDHLPDIVQFAVADLDWPLFQGSYEARRKRPFLDRLRTAAPKISPEATLPKSIRCAPRQERKRLLAETIEREAAQVLGFGSAGLDRELGFFEMGMDSLLTLEFRARLEAALRMPLPATALFDYSSVHALADFCAMEAGDPAAEQPVASEDKALRDRIEKLSEEEAEAILLAKLEALA